MIISMSNEKTITSEERVKNEPEQMGKIHPVPTVV